MQSIYLHIPFCKSRCNYCDFFSTTLLPKRHAYVDALLQEWNQRRVTDIATIYFGGGTPSLLDPEDIERLLIALSPNSPIASSHDSGVPFCPSSFQPFRPSSFQPFCPSASQPLRPSASPPEITLEANPGDLDWAKLQALRQAGINRLSIGIQSFQDPLLRLIGRRHNAQQAIDAVHHAQQAGLDNISIDLMYGLPGQTMSQWQQDVQQALTLNIQHLSCYCLSYEPGTPLTHMRDSGQVSEQDEDTLNAMYDYLCQQCTQYGMEHYEISNFALPHYRSRHNSGYWTFQPYIGLGAGAHSYDGQHRQWNVSDVDAYIRGVQTGQDYWEEETLTPQQHHMEQIMLSLRTIEGIDAQLVAHKQEIVNHYIQQGLLLSHNSRIRVSQQGSHILNRIIEDLI